MVNRCPLANHMANWTQYSLYHVNPSASGYIFRFTFRFLSDVSYSDECRTESFSVYLKNVPAFPSYSEIFVCIVKNIISLMTYHRVKKFVSKSFSKSLLLIFIQESPISILFSHVPILVYTNCTGLVHAEIPCTFSSSLHRFYVSTLLIPSIFNFFVLLLTHRFLIFISHINHLMD